MPDLHALPVLDHDEVPIGLINRRALNERMAKPFTRELNQRKSCTVHMNPTRNAHAVGVFYLQPENADAADG